MVKRYPIILIDRSVNTGIVGFRGSTQPTGSNLTDKDRKIIQDKINDLRDALNTIENKR